MFVLCSAVQIVERPENDGYVNKRSRKLVYLDLHFHFFFLFFSAFVSFTALYLVSVLTREPTVHTTSMERRTASTLSSPNVLSFPFWIEMKTANVCSGEKCERKKNIVAFNAHRQTQFVPYSANYIHSEKGIAAQLHRLHVRCEHIILDTETKCCAPSDRTCEHVI